MTSQQNPPTQSEVLGYFDSLSNWGRWGPDDQLGALNLLAPLSLWVALAATIYSGIEYFVRNGRTVLHAFGGGPSDGR